MNPNQTYIVQHRSQRFAPDNVDLKETWFNLDLEEDPGKTPIHKPSVAPDNATL